MNKDIKCFNCHKKGHKKIDCWAKGRGKEGEGPKTKERKEKEESKKVSANAAEDEDGIWMAIANASGDKGASDNKFSDFTILDNKLFFWDEDNDEEGIPGLTADLK